jgi:galactokinase
LPDPILRRCRHVITENERTLRAATVLAEGNTKEFGELMLQSHQSLRDDFAVSSDELDLMVDIAMSLKGVAGARMTGGGFGGCTVNLVKRDALASFRTYIQLTYETKTKISAPVYVVKADVGAHEVI